MTKLTQHERVTVRNAAHADLRKPYPQTGLIEVVEAIIDARLAAERDRAVAEALAPVRALPDRWDALAEISEHDRAYVLVSVADDLRAALPDEPEGEA